MATSSGDSDGGELRFSGLKLAASAADRAGAGEHYRREFEELLSRRGYDSNVISRAYSMLIGPSSVEETLDMLEQSRMKSLECPAGRDLNIRRGGPQ